MSALVVRADGRRLPLGDGTVDLVVTSPPYFKARDYKDGGVSLPGQLGAEDDPRDYLAGLWQVTAECARVLRPGGSIFVNLGDKYAEKAGPGRGQDAEHYRPAERPPRVYVPGFRQKTLMGLPWRYAIGCVDDLGLILRAEVVWGKLNGLPESVTDRVRRSHETWFHFTKEPRYYAAVDEVREPHQPQSLSRAGRPRFAPDLSQDGIYRPHTLDPGASCHPLGGLPGSVQMVATEPLHLPDWLEDDHYAAFPSWWPWWIIRGWSPKGICVECGEGRRPIAVKTGERGREPGGGGSYRAMRQPGEMNTHLADAALEPVVIVGYDCACDELIGSPTGAPGGDDPTVDAGKAGFRRPRGRGAGRRWITRWEQRHYADQLRESRNRSALEADLGRSLDHYVKPSRSSGRPLPADVLARWLERGWLVPPPPFVPPPTRPAVVLDPFGGTGTTAMMAHELGRHAISVDLSAGYCAAASWRIFESGDGPRLLAKHEGRRPSPPAATHPTLFDA